jgi:large subunit ribosomal protein L9
MKVILTKDIKGTGKKDQIIEVSDGYARNFLLPRKLAKEATATELNAISTARSAAKHREDVKKAEAEATARELKGKVVQLTARGGEGGKLYGSVTNEQIAEALKAQHGVELDKRKIELEDSIRTAGQTFATLKLYAGVSTRIIVNVTVGSK